MTTTERLQALLDAATPGPWVEAVGGDPAVDAWPEVRVAVDIGEGRHATSDYICEASTPDNAALIAVGVNALPRLLAVVEAMEEISQTLHRENADFSGLASQYPAVYMIGVSIQKGRAALAALETET